ncbi:MAG: lipopolysaccharide biosynthesis protein [Verrucomicrobiota bacterium]|jgi:O-antigen/teichoic acid export membrane protein|nr:lipopolysaccharide biosynthesis protein [Verrucomicrobiota bacterium]
MNPPAPQSSTSAPTAARRSGWRNALLLTGPSVAYLALRFLLSPIQIRVLTSLLDKADYGIISLIAATVTVIAILASFGHFEFMIRRLPGQPDDLQYATLRRMSRFFLPLILLVAVLTAVFLGQMPGFEEHGGGLSPPQRLLTAAALGLLAFLLQRIFFLVSRAEWIKVRTLQLLQSDTWFLPFLLAYALGARGLSAALWVWVGWLFCTNVLAFSWTRGTQTASPLPAELGIKAALLFGMPLLPWLVGELLLRLGDRYVLLAYRGPEIVANYTLCANIGILIYTVAAIGMDPFIPELSRTCNRAAPATDGAAAASTLFSTMLRLALSISLAGCMFMLVGNRALLDLLGGTRFLDAAGLLWWFAPVPILSVLWACGSRLLLLKNRCIWMGVLTLSACALNVGANLLVVPRFGEQGAAAVYLTTLAALGGATAVTAKAWRYIHPTTLQPLHLAAWTLVCACILGALRWLWPHAPALPWLLTAAVLCTPFAFLIGVIRASDFSFAERTSPAVRPVLPAEP